MAGTPDLASYPWPSIPFPAFVTAAGPVILTGLIVVVMHYFDASRGRTTISLLIVIAFVAAPFGAMIYPTQQTPIVEILIGGLSAALGAVAAHWLGIKPGQDDQTARKPPEDPPPK
jgi:hypothetical protein